MDSKKITSAGYFQTLLSLYKQKFSNRNYKAIIVADNYAFEFALEHADELFPDVPIIFCGVENFDPIQIHIHQASYKTTGVIELKEPLKNLKLMKMMIPELKSIYIISDKAYSSRRIQEQILEAKKSLGGEFDIIYDNEIMLETLPDKLATLPKDSAILFTSLYRDKNDRYVPYNELVEFFKNSQFPIFALTSIHVGEGIIGGYMVEPFVQGEMAGELAIRVLDGEKASQIPIQTPTAKAIFDAKQMKKFNFGFDSLPVG